MGEPLELPGGERVGQRKLDCHDAFLVAHKRREKEGRLGEIFPRGRGGCGGWGRRRRLGGLLVAVGGRTGAFGQHAFRLCRCGVGHRHRGRGRGRHLHRHHAPPPHPHHGAPKAIKTAAGGRAEEVTKLRIGNSDALIAGLPRAENRIEWERAIREGDLRAAPFAAKQTPQAIARPLVRRERVERLVVEDRQHLGDDGSRGPGQRIGHALDSCSPDFRGGRLEPPRKPLPLDRELLVGPRYVDHALLAMEPAIADEPGRHGEATAAVIGGRKHNRPLRFARRGPESLEEFAGLRDLHERPAGRVAGADDCGKLLGRGDALLLRLHRERSLHEVTVGCRIDHLDDGLRGDGGRVARSGQRECSPVDPCRQTGLEQCLARCLIGRGRHGHDLFAVGPGPRVGGIGRAVRARQSRRLRPPAPQRPRHRDGATIVEITARHLGRLHEPADRERAGSCVGLAIKRCRGEREIDSGLAVFTDSLPVADGQRRLGVGIPGRHPSFVTAGLATGIGHVGHHPIGEHRQAVAGHAAVGHGGKADRKTSIVVGDDGAAGDLTGRAVKRQPRKDPAAPDRKPHFAFDPPLHLRAGDGKARVGRGRARHGDLAPELHRRTRRGEFHEKLGPLVFLHLHADSAGVAGRLGGEHPAAW